MDKDDQPPNADFQLPQNLRFLQRLVTLLTVSMIAGIIIIVALLAVKLRSESINFPQNVILPDGTKPIAFTQTKDWYSIITDADEVLIFKNDGTLINSILIHQFFIRILLQYRKKNPVRLIRSVYRFHLIKIPGFFANQPYLYNF